MENLISSIQLYLGRELTEESLNHYSLLGIEPNASTDEIRIALKAAAASWNAADKKTNPSEAQRVATLLKQAQATLLDTNKRKYYDETIRCLVLSSTNSLQPLEPVKEQTIADVDWPIGDPLAVFDPSAFQPMRIRSHFSDVATRWRELESLVLAGENPSQQLTVTVVSTQPQSNPNSHSEGSQNAAEKIAMLRKKRRLKQNLVVGGILLAATIFLGFASIRFLLNRQQQTVAQNAPANGTSKGPSNGDTNSSLSDLIPAGDSQSPKSKRSNQRKDDSLPPVRSNLPTIAKDSDDSISIDSDAASMEMRPQGNEDPTMDMKPVEPLMPSSPTMNSTTPTATAPKSPNDMAKWVTSMKEGRAALNKLDFQGFGKAMDDASATSVGDEQIAKQKRLDQLGQLYQIGIEAMRDARAKTRGTDVVTVGKNRVNIVEVKPDEVIVRVSGKNESHPWSSLPMGLALALLDLTLSEKEPADLAARAVYLSLSPAKTDLFDRRIKELFDKSLGKGEIREDLPQALTDTYE